jgi:glutathione peroxidase-family protein
MKARKIKNIALVILSLLILSFGLPLKSIYTIKIRDINGGMVDLGKLKGKKMVIITVSGKESDSSLGHLSTLHLKYRDSATFIGVLSKEDGFDDADKQAVKKRFKEYKKLDIVLTEGMYTKKGSANQSELMKWLTHKEQNRRFNNDVSGPGQIFFIDEEGELYAVMTAHTSLSNPVIGRIMSRPRRQGSPVSN